MNKMLIPMLLAVSTVPVHSNAAVLDLTTFALSTGVNSPSFVTPNLATLLGSSALTAHVAGLASFEWKFTAGDIDIPLLNDYAYLSTSGGNVPLSDIATVGSFGTTGWKQYVFSLPYTGTVSLVVQNRLDDENPSKLQLRNFMTAPVPEPEGYAMLLAGLGLMGALAKRGSRRTATI